VKRLTEDAEARARGGGPTHQDNTLRLFGAREEDVRVTFYRDHAGVRDKATSSRTSPRSFGSRAYPQKENERLTKKGSYSRSGARIAKNFG
jgi:hypothetical protein